MFKKLLMILLFICFSVQARVQSGHQEFVHYTEEQKKEFIIQVMELIVDLENKYETSPATDKLQYTVLIEQFKKLLISNAYAATETDVTVFAKDLSQLINIDNPVAKRCIYAGWASVTTPVMDSKEGRKEVCQHPKFIKNGANSPETKAYSKSSSCGKQNQNTISCNPAIFGFKNQADGTQFCVPAGPAHSDNSSYACMQLALGVKKESGADPAEKRIEYLKKQFEGNPELVNGLYGLIYKTCVCESQDVEVINQSYLNRTRPHRTCLGLVNTIAEVNHCVDFSSVKSSEMELFAGIRSFTNNLAKNARGPQVDSNYRELLGSLKTRFASDYTKICGGDDSNDGNPPSQDGDSDGNGDANECHGECEIKDGKYVNCEFKVGDQKIEITPPESISEKVATGKVDDKDYTCSINVRGLDHKTSCKLNVSGEEISYALNHPEDIKPVVKATTWVPAQTSSGVVEKISFGDAPEVSLSLEVEINSQAVSVECGSVKNPKANDQGDLPKVDLQPDGDDNNSQKFTTKTDPENPEGWSYKWSRSTTSKPDKPSTKPPVVQGDSDDEVQEPPKPEAPKTDNYKALDNNGKTYTAPKEKDTYYVCVQLEKDGKSTDRSCKPVGPTGESEAASTKPAVGGPQLPQIQQPMRRGVNFSRGGVL